MSRRPISLRTGGARSIARAAWLASLLSAIAAAGPVATAAVPVAAAASPVAAAHKEAAARVRAPQRDQRPLEGPELERLNTFLGAMDRALVAADRPAYLECYDLSARSAALARLESLHDRLDLAGAETEALEAWRIGDRICALVRSRLQVGSTRGPRAIRHERIDHRVVLLREEQNGFRVVHLSGVRANVPPSGHSERDRVRCADCNFSIEPRAGWFVLHHQPFEGALTEKISLHHASGAATLEIEVLELAEDADPKTSVELDHELSTVVAMLPSDRVHVLEAGPLPALPGEVPGYRLQATLPRPDGGEDFVGRCYRARGEVLYAMTAYGDAEVFFERDPELLADVETMFDSFSILDDALAGGDQHARMLHRHRPGIRAELNAFRDETTGCSMAGPVDWTTRPLACGRVLWTPFAHGHGERAGDPDGRKRPGGHTEPDSRESHHREAATHPWMELTWQASDNGWSGRVESLIARSESTFDRMQGVRRGSVRNLDRAHLLHAGKPEQVLVTERYRTLYRYESSSGQDRRTVIYYIPCGKLLFVVRADAEAKEFAELESRFDTAVASFSMSR